MNHKVDDQWDRISKILGDNLLKLNRATVAIVGLGSLGSFTAVQLAMSGVGNFILIDPEVLERHNVVRHACDLRDVGRPKVAAVAELILHRNPLARVRIYQADVHDVLDVLNDADIVLVAALGLESVAVNFGSILKQMGKLALFGGIYEKAIGGEVFLVHSHIGPCYSCFAHVLRDMNQIPSQDVPDYGLPPQELVAQPGFGPHVIRITTLFSDWTLRRLVMNEEIMPFFPGNLAILSNESYTLGKDRQGKDVIIEPSSAKWMIVRKDPECLMCNTVKSTNRSIEEVLADEGVNSK